MEGGLPNPRDNESLTLMRKAIDRGTFASYNKYLKNLENPREKPPFYQQLPHYSKKDWKEHEQIKQYNSIVDVVNKLHGGNYKMGPLEDRLKDEKWQFLNKEIINMKACNDFNSSRVLFKILHQKPEMSQPIKDKSCKLTR